MSPKKRQRHPMDVPAIGASQDHPSYMGRPVSWASVAAMIFGFSLGGFGLTQGPSWIIVAVGLLFLVAGAATAYFTNIFDDTGVIEEPARYHDDTVEHGEHSLGEEKRRGGRFP